MNLQEERERLEKELEELNNQVASMTIAVSVIKSKLKKITKLIDQANEIMK